MQVDKTLISRLEKLARLQLGDEAQARLARDLAGILDLVEKLKGMDTSGVEPLAYPTDQHSVLREDEVQAQLSREEALQNAPEHDRTFFLVPKVID